MHFCFIWLIGRTLSTTLGQSGPGSDGNEGVLRIPKSSSITRTSTWLFWVISRTHVFVWGGAYSSAEKQSVHYTASADWATRWWGYPSAVKQSVCSVDLASRWWDYPSAEKQSVYFIALADWVNTVKDMLEVLYKLTHFLCRVVII